MSSHTLNSYLPYFKIQGVLACMLTLSLIACDGGKTDEEGNIRGQVTDQSGSQMAKLAGSGTIASATTVQASAIQADGSLEFLAEAEINASGEYTLDLDPGQTQVLIQAMDDSGEAVGSAILESTGAAEEEITVTPIDSESSLEALVLVEVISNGVPASETNFVDLRSRVTAEMASAMREIDDESSEFQETLAALAEGIAVAQAAEVESYARQGVSVSQSDLFSAEMSASQVLSESLDAGSSSESAYEAFFDALADVAASEGLGEQEQAEAEMQASLSARLVLDYRLGAGSEAQQAVLVEATRAIASGEARVSTAALDAILAAGEAASAVQEEASQAGTELRDEISVSTTTNQLSEAYTSYSVALIGSGSVEGSVVGNYLQVDVASAVTVDLVLEACTVAADQLDVAATDQTDALLAASQFVEPSDVATAIADAHQVFSTEVVSATSTLVSLGGSTETSGGVVLIATGSFSAAP